MTNVRTACEQRQLEQRQREKTYEKGILNITKILIVKYTQRTLVPKPIGIFDHIQEKSVDIEEKLIKIHERWEKLKSRQNDEPAKFMKTLKILKNQILELTKSKDDIIRTIKTDLTRINGTYHSMLEKQVHEFFSPKCRPGNRTLNLGLRSTLSNATGQQSFDQLEAMLCPANFEIRRDHK